jgi:hypothetical protein
MRLTIIRDDNAVYVDGRSLTVDCSSLPENVSVVQWNGTSGHVEYDAHLAMMPTPLENIDAYASLITAWQAAADAIDNPAPVPPDINSVAAERTRRLALGFNYDFGDGRGVHHIGTTAADMAGWKEVTDFANAAVNLSQPNTQISIATNTGPVTVTALEWQSILVAAALARQPLWAASFVLQAMSPIPEDYTNDSYWT